MTTALSILMLAISVPARAFDDASNERDSWKDQVEAAKARAKLQREVTREEFVRTRDQTPYIPPVARWIEKQRKVSEDALNDPTLAYGDTVTTIDGTFVFVGRKAGQPGPGDFLPAPR